jgi:hypothetical protein
VNIDLKIVQKQNLEWVRPTVVMIAVAMRYTSGSDGVCGELVLYDLPMLLADNDLRPAAFEGDHF